MGSPDVYQTEPQNGGARATEEKKESSSYNYGNTSGARKRVFRDPDDKVISGVCSGISHHFGIDPIWLRLAFGLSILIGGFGVLLYILLIIIIPKAKTAADKLEMRGEPADVQNIRKVMEEELEDLKKKVSNFNTGGGKERMMKKGESFGRKLSDFFNTAGGGFLNVLASAIKMIFAIIGILIAFVIMCVLMALLFSLGFGTHIIHIHNAGGPWIGITQHDILSTLSISGISAKLLITGIVLFLGVPSIALIVRSARTLSGHKGNINWFNWTASFLWSAGIVILIMVIAGGFSHFSVSTSTKENKDLPLSSKTLTLKLAEPESQSGSISIDSLNLYINEDGEFYGNPTLCMEQSPDTAFHLELIRSARGVSRDEASREAASITEDVLFKDSVLTISPFFNISEGTPWRKQKLQLELQVPLNKAVLLPYGFDRIICHSLHTKYHVMGGKKWMMTADGFSPL
jgi:phage shock protein C